jgi:hypothetical protein
LTGPVHQGFLWAVDTRIAVGCAATCLPKDMAHAQCSCSSFQHVCMRIPEHCSSCAVGLFWPACSPHLNPLNLYIWGYLRCLVCEMMICPRFRQHMTTYDRHLVFLNKCNN